MQVMTLNFSNSVPFHPERVLSVSPNPHRWSLSLSLSLLFADLQIPSGYSLSFYNTTVPKPFLFWPPYMPSISPDVTLKGAIFLTNRSNGTSTEQISAASPISRVMRDPVLVPHFPSHLTLLVCPVCVVVVAGHSPPLYVCSAKNALLTLL